MLKWLDNRKHKKKLKKIQQEKEIEQARCNHEFKYLGKFTVTSSDGVDLYFDDIYKIKCNECNYIEKFDYKSEAIEYCKNQ